jgi:hypothetical protein
MTPNTVAAIKCAAGLPTGEFIDASAAKTTVDDHVATWMRSREATLLS